MKPQRIDYQDFKKAVGILRAEKSLNIRDYCTEKGLNYNVLNNAMRGATAVKPEWIEIIASDYPEFMTWLKLPEDQLSQITITPKVSVNQNSNCDEYKERIKFLLEQNAKQLGMIDNTNAELMNLYKKLVEKGIKLD